MDLLRRKEQALHQHEVRNDMQQLQALLHPLFFEIGYSGKTHSYSSTINSLSSEKPSEFKIWSQDYKFSELAESVIQLTYKSAREDSHGNLSRFALRSSIWVNEAGSWKMKFHQGTPTTPFKKSIT